MPFILHSADPLSSLAHSPSSCNESPECRTALCSVNSLATHLHGRWQVLNGREGVVIPETFQTPSWRGPFLPYCQSLPRSSNAHCSNIWAWFWQWLPNTLAVSQTWFSFHERDFSLKIKTGKFYTLLWNMICVVVCSSVIVVSHHFHNVIIPPWFSRFIHQSEMCPLLFFFRIIPIIFWVHSWLMS